jgi:sulfhydrogenase subunit beta (sulfur reductase)
VLQVTLETKNLKKLVAAMQKHATVRGPKADRLGVTRADVGANGEIVLDYANFAMPLKREFFPQCEAISHTGADRVAVSMEPSSADPVVFFGVRPCDAQSIEYLDKVFSDEHFTDPYYQKRRDAALIITLACDKPAATCFCSSLGGGPASTAGADIIAFNLGTYLIFESTSPKGEAFLQKNAKLFRDPSPKEIQKREQQEAAAAKQLSQVPVAGVPEALKSKNDPALWEALAETCLSCGACTYLCPTCHCFDFFEEKQDDGATKVRVHDACMFESFVKEASGHNPRASKRDRMRQRIMHKFSYTHESFGKIFCVGCGRCIINCPSNIDIRETVAKVNS